MSIGELGRRVAMFLRRKKFDREMDEEMRLHLELREREQLENGLSAKEAHATARKSFGNALALREASHDSWGWAWFEHLAQDLRFALRMLRKSPGFTAVAVLTLALGIGANTAMFSVLNAVLLRPLPIQDPSHVVEIQENLPRLNLFHTPVDPPGFHKYSQHSEIFESTALWVSEGLNLTGAGQPQRLLAMRATASLFPLLGIRPILGRTFSAAEDTYGNGHVALLSESLWKDLFGGSRYAIGKQIQLDGESYKVIGVMPEKLQILYPQYRLWIPIAFSPKAFTDAEEGNLCCVMLARLRPKVTMAQAQAVMDIDALNEIANNPPEIHPMLAGFGIDVRPLMEIEVGSMTKPLYLLLGAVLFVLLIACANIANLLLARGSTREREIAIRAAIGAGRWRIINQLLTESILLSLAGGTLGLLFAWWGIIGLIHFAPASLPHPGTIHLDSAVLAFTLAVSTFSGLFFGLAPALQASNVDLNEPLKASVRNRASSSLRSSARRILIFGEVVLTFVLLVGAGLLLRSLVRLLEINPGFDAKNLLTMTLSPSTQVSPEQTGWQRKYAAFSRDLLSRVSAMPGVLHAALSDGVPLMNPDNSIFMIHDYHVGANGPQPHADHVDTSPGYFLTMGIPLVQGRLYTDEDIQTENRVVVIDQALANRFWPSQSALGKQIGFGSKGPWSTIIGVVGTVRSHTFAEETNGTLYFPNYYPGMSLAVRTASNPAALAGAIRSQVDALDPTQAVFDVKTMGERVSDSIAQQRFAAGLLTLFAALALILAAVGLYGVIAYMVAQRTHEIGVRMALGAQRSDVMRLVLSQGARLVVGGIGIGVVATLGLTRLMASLLFGITPTDPLTFAGVAILLALVALLACYIPARRAMRVEPMVALRYE